MEEKVLNILKQIGLVFFLAIVGLRYGGKVVDSIMTSGMHLALVAIAVGVTAMMIGFLVGKYVFKLNWILLSGAVCGGMTSTPGLELLLMLLIVMTQQQVMVLRIHLHY